MQNGQPVGEFELVYGDTDSIMYTLSNVREPRDGADAGIAIGGAVTNKFHARGHKAKKLMFENVQALYSLQEEKVCGDQV